MKDLQPPGTTCFRCKELIEPGKSFCDCGAPTSAATFKERNDYEMSQWRTYQSRVES